MRPALICLPLFCLTFSGCSSAPSKTQSVITPAGDKATVGSLTYNVTDAEIAQQLGDDAATPRIAKDRFYLVRVSVTNSGTIDSPIPAMSLVDDAGNSYNELADGNGVSNWLGVVRKVAPAQTEQGYVVFDAPSKHYRIRLNDTLLSDTPDNKEFAIDIPVGFVHEAMRGLPGASGGSGDVPLSIPAKK